MNCELPQALYASCKQRASELRWSYELLSASCLKHFMWVAICLWVIHATWVLAASYTRAMYGELNSHQWCDNCELDTSNACSLQLKFWCVLTLFSPLSFYFLLPSSFHGAPLEWVSLFLLVLRLVTLLQHCCGCWVIATFKDKSSYFSMEIYHKCNIQVKPFNFGYSTEI